MSQIEKIAEEVEQALRRGDDAKGIVLRVVRNAATEDVKQMAIFGIRDTQVHAMIRMRAKHEIQRRSSVAS